ncbi:hypothetical protein [Geobacter pickeringii]|uniref:hypothetical protein n=1 Tax=Geobacter pickeringii TaxID=345632 RepID=UPI00130DB443|nr:hypothetical protein [Geobacter pickeringii]
MRKPALMLAVAGIVALLSGCAVVDFLDGKYFDHPADYDRPQYGSGNHGGSGGGHSH